MNNPNILKDFVTNLETFFKIVFEKAKEFEQAFLPKAENLLEVALEDLLIIAGQAVLGQATLVLSGNEKFGNAVTNVVQTVEASGKTVALQTAQTAVQMAYLTAKSVAQNN